MTVFKPAYNNNLTRFCQPPLFQLLYNCTINTKVYIMLKRVGK